MSLSSAQGSRGIGGGICALRRALQCLPDKIPLLWQARIRRIRQSPLFDADFYADRNPDVVATGTDLAKHYALSGWKEHRNPSAEFSTRRYLEANPDVVATGINPLLHYIDQGQAEGRQIYPVEEEAQIEAIRDSGLFDADYYLATYTDIQPPPQDPIRHYCERGWREGRNPSEEFDTQGYLEAYADIRDWGTNPFWHYVVYGRAEFRHANPERERKRIEAEVEAIRDSGLFDVDYYLAMYPNMQPPQDPIHHYCGLPLALLYMRTCRADVWGRKPMPGFHPGVYRDIHGVCDERANSFADYIRAGLPKGPWALPVIRNTDVCQEVAGQPRIALHLHVFYEELLGEIIERLLVNNIRPDLFVSIPKEQSVEEYKKKFVNYPGQVVAIEAVPNRGRDIGPFLTAFGPRIAENYDFVGHIHTKKTVEEADRKVIEVWRKFLLENLLGSQSNRMMDRILGFMSNTPTIGMVFPDDPNVVGWGKNKPFAEELAKRLSITELPENFSFPIGSMFWARVDALRRFWALGLEWEDYPEEPIPRDGSILQALERMFPLGLTPGLNQCAVTHVVGVNQAWF